MALPKTYKPEERGALFVKLEQGDTELRVLGEIKTGYVYWNNDNKPVRLAEYPKIVPYSDIKVDGNGKQAIKDMWAMLVWNYKREKIEIYEPTQATIHNALYTLEKNDKWGDLLDYDFTVTRTGEGMKTEYTITPSPKSELSAVVKDALVANKLEVEEFGTGSAFNDKLKEEKDKEKDIDSEDIPF